VSLKLTNLTKNIVLANEVLEAKTTWERMVGLLGKKSLPAHNTLWIKNCTSIHTWFMKFAIDAVFVNKKLQVKVVLRNVKPWRLTRIYFSTKDVFEFSSGAITESNVQVGDQLNVGH